MISLLDPRVWLACAGLAVGGFATGYAKRWAGEAERWEQRVREAERTAALKLIRMHEQQQEAIDHAHQETEAARRDAAVAGGAAERLRQRFAEQARRTGAACPGAAAGPAVDLLADVQRRLDEAAGELAAEADQRRIAGIACERAYEAVRAR